MKIMMSAGEASGDMHAAAVAAEIKRIRPDAEIFNSHIVLGKFAALYEFAHVWLT